MVNPWSLNESANAIFDQVLPHLNSGAVKRILVFPLREGPDLDFAPNTFQLIALSKGREVEVFFPSDSHLNWKSWQRNQTSHYDYFLIGPVDPQNKTVLEDLRDEGYRNVQSISVTYGPTARKLDLLWVAGDT
jgi:hypothetical protein